MNTNTWLLGAVLFAVLGLLAAMTANGAWYLLISALVHFVACAVFTRNFFISHRNPELSA